MSLFIISFLMFITQLLNLGIVVCILLTLLIHNLFLPVMHRGEWECFVLLQREYFIDFYRCRLFWSWNSQSSILRYDVHFGPVLSRTSSVRKNIHRICIKPVFSATRSSFLVQCGISLHIRYGKYSHTVRDKLSTLPRWLHPIIKSRNNVMHCKTQYSYACSVIIHILIVTYCHDKLNNKKCSWCLVWD